MPLYTMIVTIEVGANTHRDAYAAVRRACRLPATMYDVSRWADDGLEYVDSEITSERDYPEPTDAEMGYEGDGVFAKNH